MYRGTVFFAIISCFFAIATIHAEPATPHFYSASYFNIKPHTERKGLLDIDVFGTYGNTHIAKDSRGARCNVLNMFGTYKMHQIGKNVDQTPFDVATQGILNTLWATVSSDSTYATLSFFSKVHYKSIGFNATFNISDSVFIGCTIPFSKIVVDAPTYQDDTATAAKDAAWTNFLNNFDSILRQAGLNRGETSNSGLEDVSTYIGWTKNLNDFQSLYFFDLTLIFGALIGSAQQKNEDKIFDFARGYDGHKGFITSFDFAFSPREWLTIGAGLSNIFLFKKRKVMRLQSASGQNGFIKLGKVETSREPENVYRLGGFFSIDYNLLAFTFGYSYACKNSNDTFATVTPSLFPPDVINSDSQFASWNHHTLHFGLSANFASDEDTDRIFFPRIDFFYNTIIRSHQTFLMNTMAGNVGCSIVLDF